MIGHIDDAAICRVAGGNRSGSAAFLFVGGYR